MKVMVAGKEYWIEFQYSTTYQGDEQSKGDPVERELTYCLIRDASAPSPGDGTPPVIATGRVVRYHLDSPNRELARKAALAKALKDAPLYCDSSFKAVRRLFWEVYLNRKQPKGRAA